MFLFPVARFDRASQIISEKMWEKRACEELINTRRGVSELFVWSFFHVSSNRFRNLGLHPDDEVLHVKFGEIGQRGVAHVVWTNMSAKRLCNLLCWKTDQQKGQVVDMFSMCVFILLEDMLFCLAPSVGIVCPSTSRGQEITVGSVGRFDGAVISTARQKQHGTDTARDTGTAHGTGTTHGTATRRRDTAAKRCSGCEWVLQCLRQCEERITEERKRDNRTGLI